ncbi:hypothetical protein RSOLAG22IIIB_09376 [Rhizoctonia solani]|uniref:Uncharacterized protein n=1 Tax=Rhizoctonia solani TaxID=456999 RepID=A0A0K6FYG1_9AGAM|nr:hypothetical protein RSOLAG22IIIB_09376 [Rhizoctonia solani]
MGRYIPGGSRRVGDQGNQPQSQAVELSEGNNVDSDDSGGIEQNAELEKQSSNPKSKFRLESESESKSQSESDSRLKPKPKSESYAHRHQEHGQDYVTFAAEEIDAMSREDLAWHLKALQSGRSGDKVKEESKSADLTPTKHPNVNPNTVFPAANELSEWECHNAVVSDGTGELGRN